MTDDFATQILEICRLMRQGYHASANQQLPQVSDMWVALVQEKLKQAKGGETALKMKVVINDFKQAQSRADFLRMADLLEFQVLPLLVDAPR